MIIKRTFCRTIITIEVLSEGPYDIQTLQQLERDIIDGDCSGKWDVTACQEVDGPTMAKLLREQHSDPAFFCLHPNGTDLAELENRACEVCENEPAVVKCHDGVFRGDACAEMDGYSTETREQL